MKNLIVAVFMLCAFGFAFAQIPANVDFTGTVADACTINSITPGIVYNNGPINALISTTTGRIDISCSAGVIIEILDVIQTSGPPLSGSYIYAGVATSTGSALFNNLGLNILNTVFGPVSEAFVVNMRYEHGTEQVPAGNYAFQVLVGLTPN